MEANSKMEVRKAWPCAQSPLKSFGGLGLICESDEAGVTSGNSATGGGAGVWVFRLLSFARMVFRVALIVLFSFFKSHASCSSIVR